MFGSVINELTYYIVSTSSDKILVMDDVLGDIVHKAAYWLVNPWEQDYPDIEPLFW